MLIAAFLAMALATADAPPGAIRYKAIVSASPGELRLADVADLATLPESLRAKAGAIRIAALAPGRPRIVLSARRISERVRGQMPVLSKWLPDEDGSTVVELRQDPSPPAAAVADLCARVVEGVAAGAFVVASDLEPAACTVGRLHAALRFDRAAGVVRAARRLEPGMVLNAPPSFALARFRPGQALTLSARVGPVTVERPVTAVRPVRAEIDATVADAEGRVFHGPAVREGGR